MYDNDENYNITLLGILYLGTSLITVMWDGWRVENVTH